MKRLIPIAATAVIFALAGLATAGPKDDVQSFRDYYAERYPDVPVEDFANGVYAIDPVGRENWEAIEEFPPYEVNIDEGQSMWDTPFANGKGYADCFAEGAAQRKNYPRWDKERKMVMTLALAINECREANGEKPLKYKKGPLASLLAYMSYQSRGQTIDVVVPEDDPDALAAYDAGRRFYFTRRGQLNLACAHCHVAYTGRELRTEKLSMSLGHATGWPVYRSKWGELGTLHRRFTGCNKQVRAKPFKAQSEQYRNLEYFLTHLSNGLSFNGPSARK